MASKSLCWTTLILAVHEFHSPNYSPQSVVGLEWQDNAASLFIQMENRDEIKLKMDNEIFEVQVSMNSIQTPLTDIIPV